MTGQHDPVGVASGSKATGGREVAFLFMTSAGGHALAVLTQSLLAYLLLPEGRGAFALCVMLAGLLSAILVSGVDRGAQHFVVAKRLGVSEGLVLALGFCLLGSAAAAAVALPIIHSDLAVFRKADTASFELSLVLVPLVSMARAAELQVAGQRRFAALGTVMALRSVVTVSAVVFLVRMLELGVDGAIVALAAGHAAAFAAYVRVLRRHCGLKLVAPRLAALRQSFGFGLAAHAIRVGLEIELRMGTAALGMLAGSAEVGLFAAAYAVVRGLMLIPQAAGTALYPRVAGGAVGRLELTGFCHRFVCLASVGAIMVVLATSAPLVRVLLSEAFLPAVPLIWILAPGVLARTGVAMLRTWFNGIGRPAVCAGATWFGLCVAVAAFLILFPALGAESVAWATSIGLIFGAVFLGVRFHRATGMSVHELWLPRRGDLVHLRALVRDALRPTTARSEAA